MHTEAHELYSLAANLLALSAVLLSALAAALSILLREVAAGPYAVAALACVAAVLIGVQQKLKVDAKAEAHHISAHRFDQLVTEAVGRSVARGIHARDVAAWEKEISLMPKTPLPRRIRVRHLAGESHCSGTAVRSAADKRATSLNALSRISPLGAVARRAGAAARAAGRALAAAAARACAAGRRPSGTAAARAAPAARARSAAPSAPATPAAAAA